jgi:cytochrome c556
MGSLCWTLVSVSTAVLTLSAGSANRSSASDNAPGAGGAAAPRSATTVTAGGLPSQQAPAKMTEQDYEAIMKKVGPTFMSMQKNLEGGAAAVAAKEAQQLVELFGEAEKFWAQYSKQDAVAWAQRARAYATEIPSAVAAAEAFARLDGRVQTPVQLRMKRARAAATNMGAMCKQCHGAYREGSETIGFRIKPGALAR